MTSIKWFLMSVILISFISCGDDPEPVNEEEVITTLKYDLTSANGETVTFQFRDLDGDGGAAPTITSGDLKANTTYTGRLTLLNETETPAENITTEVIEEAKEHQFFFTIANSASSAISITYEDADSDGNPLGVVSKINTGGAISTTLKITLRHEPNKAGAGVKNGDITNAGGETDIEVSFPLVVK